MRCVFLLLGLMTACSPKPAAPPTLPPAAIRPDHLFGITLRQPLNPEAFSARRCSTGREYALDGGKYDIVADDILADASEEHQDTSAVLAALEQFTACVVVTKELDATAIVTIADSVVAHALVLWAEGGAPTFDSMLTTLTRMYGRPFQNRFGVLFWAGDSLDLYLLRRGPFGPGTTVSLSDARLCQRYEALVHRNNTVDQRSYPCWEDPRAR